MAVEALAPGDFPPANRPIVAALQLPDHCMITGEFRDEADFLRRLGVALGRGVRMVQFRAPGLDTGSYRRLALEAKARCREAGATLLLNASPEVAASIGGVGLHLNGRRLRACRRADLESLSGSWIGASCHDLEEVRLAQGLGVDFVSLSPVQRTAT
ncbi:MAG: thiamine phosphate synthase, partial [Nitrosarchaeum sp.]